MEDLNYLYHRQQISLMAADTAATVEGRHVHTALARAYGVRIDAMRAEMLARPAAIG